MTRYAVYAIPDPAHGPSSAALHAAAAHWLSRADMRSVTAGARRYGFHATIKAPFPPRPGVCEETVIERLTACARELDPAVLRTVRLRVRHGCRVLVPTAESPDVDRLAAAVVRDLDDLRGPMTESDRARRHTERLTARQQHLLERWGYPYVLDQFRPHFTVTDALRDPETESVDAELRTTFADVLGTDIPIVELALCVEPEPGADFHTLHTASLRADSAQHRSRRTS